MSSSSGEEATAVNWTSKELPVLYLDSEIFPIDKEYQFSVCKRRLIRENDDKFALYLKCMCCDTYFWNDPGWKPCKEIPENMDARVHMLYGHNYCLYCLDEGKIICVSCSGYFRDTPRKQYPHILSLKCYCRFGCGWMFYLGIVFTRKKLSVKP